MVDRNVCGPVGTECAARYQSTKLWEIEIYNRASELVGAEPTTIGGRAAE